MIMKIKWVKLTNLVWSWKHPQSTWQVNHSHIRYIMIPCTERIVYLFLMMCQPAEVSLVSHFLSSFSTRPESILFLSDFTVSLSLTLFLFQTIETMLAIQKFYHQEVLSRHQLSWRRNNKGTDPSEDKNTGSGSLSDFVIYNCIVFLIQSRRWNRGAYFCWFIVSEHDTVVICVLLLCVV